MSVSYAISRVLYLTIIYLGILLPICSSGSLKDAREQALFVLLTLHQVGFTEP